MDNIGTLDLLDEADLHELVGIDIQVRQLGARVLTDPKENPEKHATEEVPDNTHALSTRADLHDLLAEHIDGLRLARRVQSGQLLGGGDVAPSAGLRRARDGQLNRAQEVAGHARVKDVVHVAVAQHDVVAVGQSGHASDDIALTKRDRGHGERPHVEKDEDGRAGGELADEVRERLGEVGRVAGLVEEDAQAGQG